MEMERDKLIKLVEFLGTIGYHLVELDASGAYIGHIKLHIGKLIYVKDGRHIDATTGEELPRFL
jgi:hypothetical protein